MGNKLSRLRLLQQVFHNHTHNTMLIGQLERSLANSKYPKIIEAVQKFNKEMVGLKVLVQHGEEYTFNPTALKEYMAMIHFEEGKSIWND